MVGGTAAQRVVDVDPHADARWMEFLLTQEQALVYHHPAWLSVLERAYGYRTYGLACEGPDGRLTGVMPLARSRGLITGSRLASLPRTPVAGPLASDPVAAASLVARAVEHARREPGARLELRLPDARLGPAVDVAVAVPAERTFVLTLPDDPSQLRFGSSRNHGRIRWAVNKAARSGVVVREADRQVDLRSWYRLYLETMRHHVRPPIPFRFFEAIWELLRPPGLARLLLAEQAREGRTRILAGAIYLRFGSTVSYAFNGRHAQDLAARPNDCLQWHAIHQACADGFKRYDFGETVEANEGLAQFKTKWGAHQCAPVRYLYPSVDVRGARAPARPKGTPRQIVDRVWRRLPLPATALVGNVVYRYA